MKSFFRPLAYLAIILAMSCQKKEREPVGCGIGFDPPADELTLLDVTINGRLPSAADSSESVIIRGSFNNSTSSQVSLIATAFNANIKIIGRAEKENPNSGPGTVTFDIQIFVIGSYLDVTSIEISATSESTGTGGYWRQEIEWDPSIRDLPAKIL